MLLKIREYYDSLKPYQKIELYLIPIIIFAYLIYIYIYIINHPIPNEHITNTELPNKIELPKQPNQTLEILKQIEIKSKRYGIKIYAIDTFKKGEISLSAQGGFKGIMNFIYEIEKDYSFQTITLNLTNNNKSLLLETTIISEDRTKKYDHKGLLRDLDKIQNPFIRDIKQTTAKEPIKLKAIFDNYVLIDKEFIKIGETYKKYKLISIESDSAIFSNQKEIIRVKL
ncbi:hypothetical protein [Arcobacter sp. FWKO B]|uniref:hypothetical protein n=1 Tax=Arcobacter sp. FWKO B TaxID=2593672 RepID=UPI0018A38A68|nr:hypothetical protein [Arcobacter sp. FWKO B]QOG12575.1 hypothetical protein FWKOB_07595 [Arcobacter sp. FWKO B]